MTGPTFMTTSGASLTNVGVLTYVQVETQAERLMRLSNIAAETARVCFEGHGTYLTGLAMAEIADALAGCARMAEACEKLSDFAP